jgi:hypothetical protein
VTSLTILASSAWPQPSLTCTFPPETGRSPPAARTTRAPAWNRQPPASRRASRLPTEPISERVPGRAKVLRLHPALVAQRIEHLTTDQKVGGSNPSERASAQAHVDGPRRGLLCSCQQREALNTPGSAPSDTPTDDTNCATLVLLEQGAEPVQGGRPRARRPPRSLREGRLALTLRDGHSGSASSGSRVRRWPSRTGRARRGMMRPASHAAIGRLLRHSPSRPRRRARVVWRSVPQTRL